MTATACSPASPASSTRTACSIPTCCSTRPIGWRSDAFSRTLHPVLDPAERRTLFQQGIRRFNRGEFFQCHEAWEEIWRSTTPEPKDLFQGLIQIGVGFFHFFERDRPDVARRVLAKGRRRLEPLAPVSHGLDLAALLATVKIWEAWLQTGHGQPPTTPRLEVVDWDGVR